jgi:geranylgeranyl pyrophosphate synthase
VKQPDIAEKIIAQIRALPEVGAWPEIIAILERVKDVPYPDWELPIIVCRAVAGRTEKALPGAAAVACMQRSILLVDDMLDEDPRGKHHQYGYGWAANLALAFQATAFRLVERADVSDAHQTAITSALAQMAQTTALGQYLDSQNLTGEEDYWNVVRTKSAPFYGAAYKIGALLGNAPSEMADNLYKLGALIGEIIQLEDDLVDAFETPANADWQQGRNNLLILYARTADHHDRERFVTLLPQIDKAEALEEAQQILVVCGAVSYCAYELVERYRAARDLLDSLCLPNPTPLLDILVRYADTLIDRLQLGGVEVTRETLLTS